MTDPIQAPDYSQETLAVHDQSRRKFMWRFGNRIAPLICIFSGDPDRPQQFFIGASEDIALSIRKADGTMALEYLTQPTTGGFEGSAAFVVDSMTAKSARGFFMYANDDEAPDVDVDRTLLWQIMSPNESVRVLNFDTPRHVRICADADENIPVDLIIDDDVGKPLVIMATSSSESAANPVCANLFCRKLEVRRHVPEPGDEPLPSTPEIIGRYWIE